MKYVIIGAGIVGACSAYYLSQKQEHEVILIDKEQKGKATHAGAGIICPWISRVDDPEWFAISSRGAQYYPELIASLEEIGETNTGYGFTGALATSENLDTLHHLKRKTEERKKKFPVIGEIKILEAPLAQKYFPPIDENLHALYISGSARLDGRLLGEALINGFKKNGGTLIDDNVSLRRSDGRIEVVTSDGHMAADQIIVSAGAWSKALLNGIDIPIHISPQRGQIAHVTVKEDTSEWPVILPQGSGHYIVAFDDNRVAFGATREEGSGFDYRLTAGGVQEVLQEGLKVVPGLKDSTLKETRIGFRPMGPDIKPLLGKVSDVDNLIVATGLGASGLTMGPYVGSLAAKIALNEAIDVDLTPYDPLR